MIELAALILAGGRSQRMGTPKWCLPVGGGATLVSQIILQLTAVQERIDPLRVALAEASPYLERLVHSPLCAGRSLSLVIDRCPGAGPLAALRGGMLSLDGQASHVLVLAADLVDLHEAQLRLLLNAAPTADAALWHDGIQSNPLAAVYSMRILPRLDALWASGARRMQQLTRILSPQLVGPGRGAAEDLPPLIDLDTPQAYRRYLVRRGVMIEGRPAWVAVDPWAGAAEVFSGWLPLCAATSEATWWSLLETLLPCWFAAARRSRRTPHLRNLDGMQPPSSIVRSADAWERASYWRLEAR